MSKQRIYRIWSGIVQRCTNVKNEAYGNYGGRGIDLHPKWLNSEDFIEWSLNSGYGDNLTIDRLDNNKGYNPDNCRWITHVEQQLNRRDNIVNHNIEKMGKKYRVRFCRNKKRITVGVFNNLEQAIVARDSFLKSENNG